MTEANPWYEACVLVGRLSPNDLKSWLAIGLSLAEIGEVQPGDQEKATKPRRNGNVIEGPWVAAGRAGP